MREKGTDFSIARTRYTVNKQKFLQHPMVKRISALAEDEQRKGCRPGNEGKAPLSPAHLMQKRALIAMQYSALHHRTWKTPTVQKMCKSVQSQNQPGKTSCFAQPQKLDFNGIYRA